VILVLPAQSAALEQAALIVMIDKSNALPLLLFGAISRASSILKKTRPQLAGNVFDTTTRVKLLELRIVSWQSAPPPKPAPSHTARVQASWLQLLCAISSLREKALQYYLCGE
jgi:hypothetical protein